MVIGQASYLKKDFKIGGGSLMNIEKLSLIEQAILRIKRRRFTKNCVSLLV